MNRFLVVFTAAVLCQSSVASRVLAQQAPAGSETQRILTAAASEEKYTFLVFHKDNGAATQNMVKAVKRNLNSRAEQATLALVNVADGSEKELVDRFGVSRAPLPLTVAVAPNGATTALIPTKISDEQIEEAFVTPAMAQCMKSMQDGRLVFVCIHAGDQPVIPSGVKAFASDAEFKNRVAVVHVYGDDPAEAKLIEELEGDVAVKGQTTVFLAPPGVLVGKFGPKATKDQLASALHKAGECCDDPECKHNRDAKPATRPATGASRPNNQKSGARR